LVFFYGLDSQYACVSAWSFGVAFSQGAEEFGEEFVRGLYIISCLSHILPSCSVKRIEDRHTKNISVALLLEASVFFFPSEINFSASRCASLALGYVVDIDSCMKSEVTRFRSNACLCAEERPRWRYFMRPPAMAGEDQEVPVDC
jgi:hypothetical protein